jgi:nucleotide-binding universal stress UspA family protein
MKTITFKKILVPFDFSEDFTNTLRVARNVSKISGASITVINIVSQVAELGSDFINSCVQPLAKSELYVKQRRTQIESFFKNKLDRKILIRIEIGDFNNKIIEACRKEKYDLIVVPDFQKTPLGRLFSDINPLLIMEKTKTPVISVNNYVGDYKIKNIMLPIRNVVNWFKKVPYVVELANLTGANVYVLGVANSSSRQVQKNILDKINICSNILKENEIRFELDTMFGHGEAYHDVLMESKYKKVDLIAVSSPAEFTKLKTLFNSNFYNKLMSHGHIPVLGMA